MEDTTSYGNYGIDGFNPGGKPMVHFDIKLNNIMLGYEADPKDPEDPTSDYPTILLVDFGHAELLDATDYNNPWEWEDKGTEHFQPPVHNLFLYL
jgi:serine/threonine protein kinase